MNFDQSYPTLNFYVNYYVKSFEFLVVYDMILHATSIKHHHKREYIKPTLAINKIIDGKINDWTRLMKGTYDEIKSIRAHII